MVQFIPMIIGLAAFAFWAWMFSEMTKNENLPQCFLTLSNGNDVKFDWTLAFILLNVFTAGIYYFTEYAKSNR